MIATGSGCCMAEPSPMASARGNNVSMTARVVIVIGRRRLRLASQWVPSERTWPITLLSTVRRKRSFPWLDCDQMTETDGRCLLFRGTPFKTVVAPVLAADAVMDKE
jgi:hypothetical protein